MQTGAGNMQSLLFDNSILITLANITNISMPLGTRGARRQPRSEDPGTPTALEIGCGRSVVLPAPTPQMMGQVAFLASVTFTVTNTTLAAMEVGHLVNGVTELFVIDILSGTNGRTGDVDANAFKGVPAPDGGATVMLLGAGSRCAWHGAALYKKLAG